MEPAQRNLMIAYSVVCFLSLTGLTLNLVSIFNINGMDSAKMTEDLASGLRYGFFTIAAVYLVILSVSLLGLVKKTYTRKGLMLLILLLLLTFVFGHYIFEFYIDSEAL